MELVLRCSHGREYLVQIDPESKNKDEIAFRVREAVLKHESFLNTLDTVAFRIKIGARFLVVEKGIWNYQTKDLKIGTVSTLVPLMERKADTLDMVRKMLAGNLILEVVV